MYRTPLEISEEMVNLGLQAQSGYSRVYMKGPRLSKGMPKFMSQWSEQLEAVAEPLYKYSARDVGYVGYVIQGR
jgi:hypothetical protein